VSKLPLLDQLRLDRLIEAIDLRISKLKAEREAYKSDITEDADKTINEYLDYRRRGQADDDTMRYLCDFRNMVQEIKQDQQQAEEETPAAQEEVYQKTLLLN
jgi:hypothetical protein